MRTGSVSTEKGKKMKKSDNDLIRVRNVKALFESYLTTLRSADYYSDSEKACISGVLSVMQSDIMDLPTIEQPTWISVEERLPDESQKVLCLTVYGSFCVFGWTYIDWMWFDDDEWWHEEYVTHWMPLPEPPKGDE